MGDPLAAVRALDGLCCSSAPAATAMQNRMRWVSSVPPTTPSANRSARLPRWRARSRCRGSWASVRKKPATSSSIAALLRDGGNLQRALELYAQAAVINAELGLTMDQGSNLRRAAEIHAVIGRPDLARENSLAVLDIHRSTGARPQELRDLLFLADLASTTNEPAAIVEGHLRDADHLAEALDARGARMELALARAAIADRAGDSRRVLQSLGVAREDLARGGFGGEWQASMLRARAYARLGRLDSAAGEGRAAVAAVERVRGGFGSPMLRSSFAAEKGVAYSDLVDILLRLDRTSEAFEVADGARSHAWLGTSGHGFC